LPQVLHAYDPLVAIGMPQQKSGRSLPLPHLGHEYLAIESPPAGRIVPQRIPF
jgi:hypothetical protein